MQIWVPSMSKQEMPKLHQWKTLPIIATTLTFLRLLSYGVVVLWLVVGYLILPLMFYAAITTSISSMGGSVILGRVVGLSMLLWILGYPLLLSAVLCMRDLILAILVLSRPRF